MQFLAIPAKCRLYGRSRFGMEDLKNVFFSPLPDTTYVRPFRFNYTQNGKEKSWDLLEVHDSVAIIIFNVERKMLVFVKQFRPGEQSDNIIP